jgi:hypothetical protein
MKEVWVRRAWCRLMLAMVVGLCAATGAAAQGVVELAGVKYEPTAQVGTAKLVLNGAGIRYKAAIFKVYTAGLYLPEKTTSAESIFHSTAARRMHIVMLREIDATELGKLFTKGMEENASREEFAKSIPGVIKMGEMFAGRKRLAAGDWFTVDWVPGSGTVISVNGKPEIEPIKEPEFFTSLMRIWLGEHPADAGLKDALLGKPRRSVRQGEG